jgi:vacuolar protein sorting-associated protein 13A/C
MSSAELDSLQDKNLLTVKYTRAQQNSPDFVTVYGGIDQNIDITITTVIIRAAPEPVLAMYDFVMTTFVPKSERSGIDVAGNQSTNTIESNTQTSTSSEKIHVRVKLAMVQSKLFLSIWSLH